MISFQQVVKEYRHENKLSLRGFAEQITEGLSSTSVSGQTISRWEKGLSPAPDLYLFLNCITTYTDWRRDFAVDSLRAVMPHVFKDGVVTFNLPQ